MLLPSITPMIPELVGPDGLALKAAPSKPPEIDVDRLRRSHSFELAGAHPVEEGRKLIPRRIGVDPFDGS